MTPTNDVDGDGSAYEDLVGVSPALIQSVEPFDPEELIIKAAASSEGTYAGYEQLVVAVANAQGTRAREPSQEDIGKVITAAERDLGRQVEELPELQRLLRTIRAIRPPWLTCPLYAELLGGFDARIRDLTGFGVREIFEAAENVHHLVSSDAGGRAALPKPLRPFYGELAIPWVDVETPEDLYGQAFVATSWGLLVLGQKLPELVYQLLCDRLERSWSKFNTRKGDVLEGFVQQRLEDLGPSWDWYQRYYIEGQDAEKDHLGLSEKTGIPVESKCLRIRASSATWANLDAASDLERMGEAWDQLRPVMDLLRDGGKIETDTGTKMIDPKAHVHGIIVTDHMYTPYVRACLDGHLQGTSDNIYRSSGWHGEDVWVVSFVDLHLMTTLAGSPAVLLDYLHYIRARKIFRVADEPEAWLLYGIEPALQTAEVAQANVIPSGFDWEKLREQGPEAVEPPWLARRDEVSRWEGAGRMDHALRLLEQDRDQMKRHYRERRANLPDDPQALQALLRSRG